MSSYAAAVDHLFGLTQELVSVLPHRKFDLDHMRTLAHALGDPQTRFPAILIAGTNGKGSTAATLASILAAAGYRTGLYTSPHLTRVTERIRTSNFASSNSPFTEIPEADFARLYFRVDDAAKRLVSTGQLPHHPSFFETLTALAFLYFANCAADGGSDHPVDIAVLEVGMGGRLDATNIVYPILSVITDISLDHQEYLGTTIAQIAREKAGILRHRGNLITLPQHPEANHVIGEVAIDLGVRAVSAVPYLPDIVRSPVSDPGAQDAGASSPQSAAGGDSERPATANPLHANRYTLYINGQPLCVRSPLPGEHQRRNIALAIAAALELGNGFRHLRARECSVLPSTIYQMPLQAIERGIAATSWPGRLELLPPNLLLDVAHNPAGAWALRAAISALPEDQPKTLIFSCLRDKDLKEISRILFPLFDSSTSTIPSSPTINRQPTTNNLILTPVDSPRAASLDALLEAARALQIPAQTAPSPAEALALARRITPPDGLIVATGSIYLVGALREAALQA